MSKLLTFSHLWLLEAIGQPRIIRPTALSTIAQEMRERTKLAVAFLLHNCTVGRILNRSHLP